MGGGAHESDDRLQVNTQNLGRIDHNAMSCAQTAAQRKVKYESHANSNKHTM